MENNEEKKLAFELADALPEAVIAKYKNGEFAAPEDFSKAVTEHYQNAFKVQGWKDPKGVTEALTGAHNAVQNKLKKIAADLEIEGDFSAATDTNGVIETLQNVVKTSLEKAKQSTKKDGSDTEETKSLQKQLAQLQDLAKKASTERDDALKKALEFEQKAKSDLLALEDQYEAESVIKKSMAETQSKRLPSVSERAIIRALNDDYALQLVRNDSGQIVKNADGTPEYKIVNKKTQQLVMDEKNAVPMNLTGVLENVYKSEGYYIQQPAQEASGAGNQQSNNKPAEPPIGGSKSIDDIFNGLPK